MGLLDLVETVKRTKSLPPLVTMLEGAPKTGKTTQALTWPKPLLLDFPLEDGGKFHPGARRFLVKDFAQVLSLASELKGSKEYQTVIVDTVDAAWELMTQGRKLKWQEYGEAYQTFLGAIRALTVAGLHVVLTAHVKDEMDEEKDDRGKKVAVLRITRNMLPSKLSQRLAGMTDHILHAIVSPDGTFGVQCQPGKKREAGGRLRCLPPFIPIGEDESLFSRLEAAYSMDDGKRRTRRSREVDPDTGEEVPDAA